MPRPFFGSVAHAWNSVSASRWAETVFLQPLLASRYDGISSANFLRAAVGAVGSATLRSLFLKNHALSSASFMASERNGSSLSLTRLMTVCHCFFRFSYHEMRNFPRRSSRRKIVPSFLRLGISTDTVDHLPVTFRRS